jgi:hypothetical protein
MSLVANNPTAFDRAFQLMKRHRQYPFEKILTHRFSTLDSLQDTMNQMADQNYTKGVFLPF